MEKPSNICENKHTNKNPQGDIYLTQQVKQNSNQLELNVKKDPLKDEKNKELKDATSPLLRRAWGHMDAAGCPRGVQACVKGTQRANYIQGTHRQI